MVHVRLLVEPTVRARRRPRAGRGGRGTRRRSAPVSRSRLNSTRRRRRVRSGRLVPRRPRRVLLLLHDGAGAEDDGRVVLRRPAAPWAELLLEQRRRRGVVDGLVLLLAVWLLVSAVLDVVRVHRRRRVGLPHAAAAPLLPRPRGVQLASRRVPTAAKVGASGRR